MKSMRDRIRIVALFLCGLALVGCMPSWNPFYTEKDLVFEKALVGSWRPADAIDTSKESWEFSKNGEKLYLLKQTDERGRTANFEAALFKLNNQLFLDLYLKKIEGDDDTMNIWAALSLVPAHLLIKVEQFAPSFKMAIMNPDWMQKHVTANPEAIAHRVVENGIVLSSTTAELQKFLIAHSAEKEFFAEAKEMKAK